MPKELQETGRITEAAVAQAKKTGSLPVQLVSPGWGSSGYYSADVLEAAVDGGLFPAGMHMYADHPTAEEAKARPVRSIKDLVSVSVAEARIATDDDVSGWGADPGAVVTEAEILPAWRDLALNEHFAAAIGLSIRGDGELSEGEAEGRTGRIVESLAHVQSTDWVTRAGRGGKVLSLLESAQATSRAIARGIEEATAEERREQLVNAVKAAHGDDDHWAWVRDFDEDFVWFEISAEDEPTQTWQQAYTAATDDLSVSLTGERTEVRAVTKYVPATRSDSNNTTEESKEDPMPEKKIEEAEYNRLVEADGRVAQLQEQLTTVTAQRDTLQEADRRRTRSERAVAVVEARAKEADVTYTPLEVRGLCADLPLTESGELDEATFASAIDEDAAARKAAAGAGTVIGLGGGTPSSTGRVTGWDQIDEALGLGKEA